MLCENIEKHSKKRNFDWQKTVSLSEKYLSRKQKVAFWKNPLFRMSKNDLDILLYLNFSLLTFNSVRVIILLVLMPKLCLFCGLWLGVIWISWRKSIHEEDFVSEGNLLDPFCDNFVRRGRHNGYGFYFGQGSSRN